MKTLRFLTLGLLATAAICRGQITDPGWFQAGLQPSVAQPVTNTVSQQSLGGGQVQTNVPATPIAEAITPQIQALADGLQDNPTNIFNYVHDHIQFVLYFGSKKGANLTLLEKKGNDFDQCALLVALLRAAGYTNVQYQFGWEEIPYNDPDPYDDNYDLQHWWQLTYTNTVWTNTINYVSTLNGSRGYPLTVYYNDGVDFSIQRLWVALTIGSTTYELDPAFKVSQPVAALSGFSLTNAMGGSGTSISNAILGAANGTDTVNYAQNLSESAVRSQLTTYSANLLNSIQSNAPNASVQNILGGWQIVPANDPVDFSSDPYFYPDTSEMPVVGLANEPTNLMSTFQITFAGTNYQCLMPQLQGQRISLTYSNNGVAQLWLEDTMVAQGQANLTGGTNSVVLAVTHPIGYWNIASNLFIYNPTNFANTTVTNTYQSTNSNYAIMYAFEPDWGWLQQRESKLDAYIQGGYANSSRQVMTETLNVMGLNWLLQTAQTDQMLASQLGILPMAFHRIGRMGQETGRGYYVDVYMQLSGELPNGGIDTPHLQVWTADFDLWMIFGSALEHGLIEELQNTNLVGASTVKMLQIANTNNEPIYLASSANWSTGYNVQNQLTPGTYDSGTLATIANYINQGFYVLLPQSGSNHVSSVSGSWAGYGYEARLASNTSIASRMIISGGYHGGYSSDPTIPINPVFIDTSGDNQPDYFDDTPILTPPSFGADPVDLANGTFQVENTDMSLGQAEPRGITLSRYYNGTRRFSNPAGMTGGWIHNYSITANNIAAPQACFGGTTPAQAAAMFTATAAAIATYNDGQPDPKNWLTTALIAKWGIDQVTKSGVSINLGKDTLQFVQQPGGTFTPPANSTATLTQSGSAYSLQMRHGNAFNFNSSGLLINIVDQYGQSLNLTYNASNWVNSVSDWKSRTLNFYYTGTPSQLTSVSDGTRTVYYNYSTTYNPQGDLTSFTDAEGKTSTYIYDTNHQITATRDAQSQLVVSNSYDSQGHVKTQYTQGLTNKTWLIYWTGWQTTEVDPAGGTSIYFYDSQSRLTDVQDALGHLTQTFYDGQNHIVKTVSPLNETNLYFYDGNNNLTNTVDPMGSVSKFAYDNQNNLAQAIDPKNNISNFGYNNQFSLIGSTNGAGDYVNYAYNSDGTLASLTDSGGQTTYTYDSTYRQLIGIGYPNGDSESFANNLLGDVISHTDGNGNVTTNSYNKRRQLLVTAGPASPVSLVTTLGYDAVGNLQTNIDARGNVSTNLWSPTHKLLSTTLPATPQGVPVVSNVYDVRDWMTQTLDPFQNATQFTNDIAGRLIAASDPLSRTTRMGYDADGRNLAVTNAAGEKTFQRWNKRGQLIAVTNNANLAVRYGYDAAGNRVTLTNRLNHVWTFQYDAANRLISTMTPLGYSNVLTFNHQGLLQTLKDQANQTTTYGYDAKGRLTSRMDNVGTTTNGYDANNNLLNEMETGDSTNSWTYDAYNRVSSYHDVYGNLIQYKYDGNGNLTNLVYPGGKNVYYAFDSNNHMTNVTDWAGRKTSIAYDLAGRLTSITRPNGTLRTIAYDLDGEATNIIEEAASKYPIAFYTLGWTNSGRVAWEFAAPLPHTNAPPSRTMTYDADNRLLKFNNVSVTNDADGNLLHAPLTNSVFTNYIYDARNRLLNAGGVTNTYDAMNNRVGQTQGTNSAVFVVNPNAKLPQVLMRIKNGVTNYYVYGAGLLYQVTETANGTNVLTYHYDYRGSTVALTDTNGNITDRIEYSLYATTTYRAGTNDTPFLFNGRYGVMTDPNGLLYMRARYYSPYLCRFLNPDPSGFSGGLNFYAYANGNPVSYLDPFGLWSWGEVGSDALHFGEGVVVGAGVAIVVVVAAPEIAAGGAIALGWAGVEATTATTASTAIVTGGLGVSAVWGGSRIAGDAVGSAQAGNWNQVSYDAGTLTGGFLVGGFGGGRYIADNVSPTPSTVPPSWNPFTADEGYGFVRNPNLPLTTDIYNWLGTGPTPTSGGTSAGLTSAGIGQATGIDQSIQSSGGDWLTPSTGSSSSSLPSQSSSTGK